MMATSLEWLADSIEGNPADEGPVDQGTAEESTVGPSKYAIRLSNQAIKSSLSRFSCQIDGLNRYLCKGTEFNAAMEYQRALHESKFLLTLLQRVADEFTDMPELQNQMVVLCRYHLALSSIQLHNPRCCENLKALRSSYLGSIEKMQGYIEQLLISLD